MDEVMREAQREVWMLRARERQAQEVNEALEALLVEVRR
jgi:hypothetical protein